MEGMVLFESITGLWGLLALVPFFIIYLRRPKMEEQMLPSLLFILQDQQEIKRFSFFKKFFSNILFYIQLLVILSLALALAEPLITLPYDGSREHTVIALDASASMQTKLGAGTRFSKAVAEAQSRITGKTSIILAESTPVTLLREGNSREAKALLASLMPKATPTNLGPALLAAKDALSGTAGKVVVLSDFLQKGGSDLSVARRELAALGNDVEFVHIASEASNVGIVELAISGNKVEEFIKNYDKEERKVTVSLVAESGTEKKALTLMEGSIESASFDTPLGKSRVAIEEADDLAIDNTAYAYVPPESSIEVLYITNRGASSIIAAIGAAATTTVHAVTPPVLTITRDDEKIEPYSHDVIVVDGIKNVGQERGILPGTFEDIRRYVEKGGNLIIVAQDDLQSIDLRGLLPVELVELATDDSAIVFDQPNNRITKDITLASTRKHFTTAAKHGHTLLSAAETNATLLVVQPYGAGNVAYYGIADESNPFATSASYPIFWNELVQFMVGIDDLSSYHLKTGELIAASQGEVATPSGSIAGSRVLADEAGYYAFDSTIAAANLLDEDESDVSGTAEEAEVADSFVAGRVKSSQDAPLALPLLMLALALMILEVLYIKRRGDL